MRSLFISLLFVILTMSVAGPAAGESGSPLWKKVGAWQVRVDQTVGHGCFAVSLYEEGSLLRIGFDINAKGAYIIVGNGSWKSIELGKEYEIKFQFDDEAPWSGVTRGFAFDREGPRYLMGAIESAEFFSEFSRKNALSIGYRGREIARLSLMGSRRAIEEMLSCQQAMSDHAPKRHHSKHDPFGSGSQRPVSDPFR